jgi:serine/threonine protein kinase
MSDIETRLTAALNDRYTIERELGEGGMATVYLARDLRHNRRVAIKVLKPELAAVVGARVSPLSGRTERLVFIQNVFRLLDEQVGN